MQLIGPCKHPTDSLDEFLITTILSCSDCKYKAPLLHSRPVGILSSTCKLLIYGVLLRPIAAALAFLHTAKNRQRNLSGSYIARKLTIPRMYSLIAKEELWGYLQWESKTQVGDHFFSGKAVVVLVNHEKLLFDQLVRLSNHFNGVGKNLNLSRVNVLKETAQVTQAKRISILWQAEPRLFASRASISTFKGPSLHDLLQENLLISII